MKELTKKQLDIKQLNKTNNMAKKPIKKVAKKAVKPLTKKEQERVFTKINLK